MILADFNLSFFTTIPGMLITGGVLLLLIALIIFIATGSKKGKKNKKEESVEPIVSETPTVENSVNAVNTTPEVAAPVNNMDPNPAVVANETISGAPEVQSVEAPVVESTPTTQVVEPSETVVETTPVNPVEPANIPTDIPVTPEVQPVESVAPVVNVTPVADSAVAAVEPVQIVSEEPKVENINVPTDNPVNVVDNSTPTEVADSPAITIVDEVPKEQASETVAEEPKPIYGGVSPVIPKIEVAGEQHRPIYGGANPLENTQSIPIANRHVEEEPATIPTITPTAETPKAPEVENITTPTVENNPAAEPVIPTVSSEEPKVEKETIVPNVGPKKEVEVESLF